MKRRKTPSPALEAARAQGLASISAAREAKRAKLNAETSSVAAPVDSGTDPPPAGRFRRSCRTPTAQVQSGRPVQLPPLLRTARRRLVEAMPQYVYQPHPPGSHAHAPQLPPSRCVHRCARTHAHPAPDCAVAQAASAASAAPSEPSTSAAQQPASPVRPLSACPPLHPPVACACARSTGLRPGYGCSPAVPNRLRMPAMLAALRRQTTWVTRR